MSEKDRKKLQPIEGAGIAKLYLRLKNNLRLLMYNVLYKFNFIIDYASPQVSRPRLLNLLKL